MKAKTSSGARPIVNVSSMCMRVTLVHVSAARHNAWTSDYLDSKDMTPPTAPSPTSFREDWERAYAATPERPQPFVTLSGDEINPLYTAEDVTQEPGYPGQFPF